MTLAYLDTETTGLDPALHQPWEVAYALDDGPVRTLALAHTAAGADPEALRIGGYYSRGRRVTDDEHTAAVDQLRTDLAGVTLVGANPAFDESMLRGTLTGAPWSYRKVDVTSAVMYLAGWPQPKGLLGCTYYLRGRGFRIPMPNHTAAGDVATVRAVHRALLTIHGSTG